MNFKLEFKDYAIQHMGVSLSDFEHWSHLQEKLYGVQASMTPYVLEERELRVTQIDIFSRMMMERKIWLAGPVNDRMSTVVQAQLLFLDNLENSDITIHVDTPGGSVKSGLSMVDVMNYVNSDIVTINTGMAASMGSILLGAGTKGKRFSLPSSRVMLHQVSSGAVGNIQDMEISMTEAKKMNDLLFELLGSYTNKSAEQVKKDAQRDLWFSAEEAFSYGIIDDIIKKKSKTKK
jgi:ATP-dependent Clp protease protease subunit